MMAYKNGAWVRLNGEIGIWLNTEDDGFEVHLVDANRETRAIHKNPEGNIERLVVTDEADIMALLAEDGR